MRTMMLLFTEADIIYFRLSIPRPPKKGRVGVEVVRQLHSVLQDHNAVKGVILTNGRFSKDAVEESKSKRIELVDDPQLRKLFSSVGLPLGSLTTG